MENEEIQSTSEESGGILVVEQKTIASRQMRAVYLHQKLNQTMLDTMMTLKEIYDNQYYLELGFSDFHSYIKESTPLSNRYVNNLMEVVDKIQGEIVEDEFTDKKIKRLIHAARDPKIAQITGSAKLVDESGNEVDAEEWYQARLKNDESEFIRKNQKLEKDLKDATKKAKDLKRQMDQDTQLIKEQTHKLSQYEEAIEFQSENKDEVLRAFSKKGSIEILKSKISVLADFDATINDIADELKIDHDIQAKVQTVIDLLESTKSNLLNAWNPYLFASVQQEG